MQENRFCDARAEVCRFGDGEADRFTIRYADQCNGRLHIFVTPFCETRDQRIDGLDEFEMADAISHSFVETRRKFERKNAGGCDPDVCAGRVDDARRGARKADEKAELDDNQHDRECDARQRCGESAPIMGTISPGY